jgi:hypothetical protein
MPFATVVELDAGAHLIEVRAEAIMLNVRGNSCEVYFKEAAYHGMTIELLQPCDQGGGS